MKKSSVRQPVIESKTAPEYGFNKQRPLKIPSYAWFVILLSLIMATMLFVVYGISFNGSKDAKNTLLIYSDGKVIPEVAIRNSLAACDFTYEIIEPDIHLDDVGFTYDLPKGYSNDKVVVCAIGNDAFKVMDDLVSSGASNVEGYVLINPEYPGNIALATYTSEKPSVPCAIFGFDSKAKSSTELSGAQMIFEKISGVDTMYGHATTRGRLFSSKVYVSPNQMRYLSLSSETVFGTEGLLFSPAFQNELSQYLGTTFGKGYSSSQIVVRQILLVLAIFLSIATLALFLFMVPVALPDKAKKELKGRDSLGAIIFLGLSGWIALCGAVMTFIPQIRAFTKYIAIYAPVLIIALMSIAQLRLIATKKIVYNRKDSGLAIFLTTVLVGLIEIMIVFGTALNLMNVEKKFGTTDNIIEALIVFVVMSLSAVALILSDKKSRAARLGRTAFFASPAYFIEVLIPPVVLLIMGIIQSNPELITSSIVGITLTVLPLVCALPLKRLSDYYELTGLVFGIVAGVIMFIAG